MSFEKEAILPATNPQLPFFVNLPAHDARPVSHLIDYFKFWKTFIKSLIYYLKELCLIKEFDANLNFQLINSVQFPSFKSLPSKYRQLIEQQQQQLQQQLQQNSQSPNSSGHGTPKNELKKTLSNTSVSTLSSAQTFDNGSTTPPIETKRPNLFKTKSNQSFLKGLTPGGNSNSSANSSQANSGHKRNISFNKFGSHTSQVSLLPQPHSPNQLTTSLPKHANQLTTSLNKQNHQLSSTKQSPQGNGNATNNTNVNDVHVPANYFAEDSLFNNLAPALINHHYQLYQSQSKFYRELVVKLIPRLENLLKNLGAKIKEIKSTLKNDSFANTYLIKEISKSGKILNSYISSIERYSQDKPVTKKTLEEQDEEEGGVLDDPFLIKLQVDYQIKNQLIHESYMFASYINLQNISKDLLTYVLKELNIVIDKCGKLINQESVYSQTANESSLINLLNILKKTVPDQSSSHDWEYFILNNPNFINTFKSTPNNPKKEIRSFTNITLPYANSIHNKCLRFGIMYKKLKILKNYNCYYYVLTCNYLHEFRLDREDTNGDDSQSHQHSKKNLRKDKIGGFIGHDDFPIKSYNLNDYNIKSKDDKDLKFVLIKISKSSQKHTFKCSSGEDYDHWFGDLYELLKFGKDHLKRFNLVEEKVQIREEELNKKKELKKQLKKEKEMRVKLEQQTKGDKSAELRLNLNSLLPKNGLEQNESLSGIFTPRIHTPNESIKGDAGMERNPFENTLYYEATSPLTSPNLSSTSLPGKVPTLTIKSPHLLPAMHNDRSPLSSSFPVVRTDSNNLNISPPALIATSPAGTQKVELPHQVEHEMYLKMQQEVLRQQQEVLNQRIENAASRPHSPKFSVHDGFLSTNSRASSNELINSMIHQPTSNIQKMINSNKNMINSPTRTFELNDSDSSHDVAK